MLLSSAHPLSAFASPRVQTQASTQSHGAQVLIQRVSDKIPAALPPPAIQPSKTAERALAPAFSSSATIRFGGNTQL